MFPIGFILILHFSIAFIFVSHQCDQTQTRRQCHRPPTPQSSLSSRHGAAVHTAQPCEFSFLESFGPFCNELPKKCQKQKFPFSTLSAQFVLVCFPPPTIALCARAPPSTPCARVAPIRSLRVAAAFCRNAPSARNNDRNSAPRTTVTRANSESHTTEYGAVCKSADVLHTRLTAHTFAAAVDTATAARRFSSSATSKRSVLARLRRRTERNALATAPDSMCVGTLPPSVTTAPLSTENRRPRRQRSSRCRKSRPPRCTPPAPACCRAP
jgi:hypothetical protein